MPNIGLIANKVNSKKFNIYAKSTANEILFLQNARMSIIHTEEAVDTTSGGTLYFSGGERNVLEATIVYTEGLYKDDIAAGGLDINTLLTRTNGEVAEDTWLVRLTGKGGSTEMYTLKAKLEEFIPNMDVPGGAATDIRLVITEIAVTS